MVVAALFGGLSALGGGAGFVIGAVASLGAEHHGDGTIAPGGLHGDAGGSVEGPDRD